MLHEFLTSHRTELIRRCREKVAKRFKPAALPAVIDHGVPLFLQQLTETLRRAADGLPHDAGKSQSPHSPSVIGQSAALHGAELLRRGYTVDQVVHDYGDVCQAVTEMAVERNALIDAGEFRILNGCLDNAIADALTAFGQAGNIASNEHAQGLQQRQDSFADEHRRLADIAINAYAAIQTGNVAVSGATGALLVHALNELRSLADRSLPKIHQAAATATTGAPDADESDSGRLGRSLP